MLLMAMDRAYTADYKLVFANEAVKGKNYFCPACNGILHFYPGTTNAPHFRHSKGVPKVVKEACELYSQGLGENSIYENEIRARQKVRLALLKNEGEFQFELKFPLLNQMLNTNQYITYSIEEIIECVIHSIQLHSSRKKLNYSVPLIGRYTIRSSDEILERKLGLLASGILEPFKDGPLLFKEIQGEYLSIPYRKLHISGKFYVVSYGELLTINKDIFCSSTQKINKFYIYEFHMPVDITDEIIRWFNIYLNYVLQPATYMIDLYAPTIFQKQGSTVTIAENKSSWIITNLGNRYENERLVVVYPDNTRRIIPISSGKLLDLSFQKHGDYLIYMDQGVSEMINIRFAPEINHNYKFDYGLLINNADILFEKNKIADKTIHLTSSLKVDIHETNFMSYSLRNCIEEQVDVPVRIDIPTLWSVQVKENENLQMSQELDLDYLLELYSKAHLFPKVVCEIRYVQKLEQIVKFSEFNNKTKLLNYIRNFGIKIPSNVTRYIKEYFK